MGDGRFGWVGGGLMVLATLALGGCVAVEEAGPEYTGPTAAVVLDGDNAGPVAWQAFDMLDGLDVDIFGMLAELPVTSRVVAAGDSVSARTAAGPLARLQQVLSVLPKLRAQTRTLPAGVVLQGWLDCGRGGIRWKADQALPGAVSPGDRYTLDYLGCEEGDAILDGRVVVSITDASGVWGESDYRLAGTARFEALAFTTIADGRHGLQDGAMDFEETLIAGVRRVRASGPALYLRYDGEQFLLADFDFRLRDDGLARTQDADFVLYSTILGGRIDVSTLASFTREGLYPWRGSLVIHGAGGAWIRLDAEPDARNVTMSWAFSLPAGDVAEGMETVSWLALPFWRPLGW